MREPTKNRLTPVAQKFILHWGEMGTRWGINRTVAQVHALLFLSPQPLPADEISDTLAVARSNVSPSLRQPQGWRIGRVVHALGDPRAAVIMAQKPVGILSCPPGAPKGGGRTSTASSAQRVA